MLAERETVFCFKGEGEGRGGERCHKARGQGAPRQCPPPGSSWGWSGVEGKGGQTTKTARWVSLAPLASLGGLAGTAAHSCGEGPGPLVDRAHALMAWMTMLRKGVSLHTYIWAYVKCIVSRQPEFLIALNFFLCTHAGSMFVSSQQIIAIFGLLRTVDFKGFATMRAVSFPLTSLWRSGSACVWTRCGF